MARPSRSAGLAWVTVQPCYELSMSVFRDGCGGFWPVWYPQRRSLCSYSIQHGLFQGRNRAQSDPRPASRRSDEVRASRLDWDWKYWVQRSPRRSDECCAADRTGDILRGRVWDSTVQEGYADWWGSRPWSCNWKRRTFLPRPEWEPY